MKASALLLFLNGCASLMTSDPCVWDKPVRPEPGDDLLAAPGLVKSALAHNRAGQAICGWAP